MLIPHAQLSPATLRAVVEEFATRDGTDHSSVEQRIESVLSQLDANLVVVINRLDLVAEEWNLLLHILLAEPTAEQAFHVADRAALRPCLHPGGEICGGRAGVRIR